MMVTVMMMGGGNYKVERCEGRSRKRSEVTCSVGMNTYRPGGTPGVIGSQEVYRDPRERRTSQSKPEAGERPSPMPEKLPFRERQRLFSQGQDVANKIKTSRKLMELEQELGNK